MITLINLNTIFQPLAAVPLNSALKCEPLRKASTFLPVGVLLISRGFGTQFIDIEVCYAMNFAQA
ncbi:hypothetical protein DBY68_007820 [Pseudocitrobacter sp. RIT415]|uniref:hypothetical protein n=1 Tax=Pseudocitrobacter faecalis TaxID=1398493 RepID=UPI000D33E09C|nr:hypothetical protein DBY68_007820 [Pseudocitrobacter sp. RIT 415]